MGDTWGLLLAHCPVVVVDLGHRGPLESDSGADQDLSASAREQFELALRVLNSALQDQRTRITLLHVHDPRPALKTGSG